MDKDLSSFGPYSKCRSSIASPHGYPNGMSVVWVSSEPTNQLEEDHNCEGEDPLGGTPDELLRHSDHTGIGECHRTSNYGGNISSVEHTAAPTLMNRHKEQRLQKDMMSQDSQGSGSMYCNSGIPSGYSTKDLQRSQGEQSNQRNTSIGDTSCTSQNFSCSSISSDHESESSDEEAADGHQQNTAASANWKDFLAGLRTGHYEMSDTFRHHMDPDTPLFLPDDHGKSDNESDSSSEKATKPSKRSKVVEAKEALNRGQEHVNTKGKLIRARRMGDGCGKKSCRFKCEERITKEARTNIFNYFWNLGNHQLQWLFIAMHTSVRTPKQRTKAPESSRRKTSRKYYFRQGTGKIPVCKTMFLETLDVSDSWVDTAISKAANGVVVAPDCRGRHSKAPRKSTESQEGSSAKLKQRGRKKSKCCPPLAYVPSSEESAPQESQMCSDHLPLKNIANRCDQDDEKIRTSDFREADIANNRRTVEDEGEYISEENMPDMNTLHNDTRGVDGLENHHMEGEEDSSIMFVPKMVMHVVSETSEFSDGAGDGGSVASWSDGGGGGEAAGSGSLSGRLPGRAVGVMLGVDKVGVGGLLGVAAVPEAFQHHLDPVTLGLRELPNGAVLSLSGEDSEDTSSSSGKKRREPQPSRWRANRAKEALNTGKEHVNMKGKLIRARSMGEGCVDSCRFKCKERIDLVDRQAIFDYFWNLGDHQLQWLFISQQTRVRAPKQRTQDPERSRRKTSRSYFFTVGHSEIPVCKTMFLRTLDVSDSWVESAIQKVVEGGGVAVAGDRRGRHRKVTRRISDSITGSVREHIQLFPRSGTPPTAGGFKRKCIGDGYTVSKMHRMYLEWMQEGGRVGMDTATERQYRDILTSELKSEFPKQEPQDPPDSS